MVDISSQNNKINVTVSSSGNTANTNVTPDYAKYYSEKSKEWATSNRIVDNTDYSSKYYANESKKQADISTAKATEVIESGNTAVSNIESARDNAIMDVNTAGATQVALATEQATIATNKTSEVVASGNKALANIDTAKDNAITSITNQETTSKNVLIDEGATQIGLIQNEGATQVANVQSTGFYMRDDKLYYINSQGEETEFKSGGSGLELCDIGMSLYVDETKGLRRYLNGQVVERNTNTQAFLNRLKEITTLHPSLLCTEEEWQTAKTMSAFGQVGKFVFNYSGDNIVSVRLPRVVNIQGLFDLQNLGMTVDESLPNIKGRVCTPRKYEANPTGAFYTVPETVTIAAGAGTDGSLAVYMNASRSSSTYQDNAPVQPEAIQYPYFIQIATGSETENNIINDIELNNPYSLFDSKYSDHELNNLSWLKSEGQWNSKAVYPDAYDELLREYNSPDRLATFNKDAFTVVGNPTITDDGVASGFSSDNYIKASITTVSSTSTFEIKIKFKLSGIPHEWTKIWGIGSGGYSQVYILSKKIVFNWTIQDIHYYSAIPFSFTGTEDVTYTFGWNGTQIYSRANINGLDYTGSNVSLATSIGFSEIYFANVGFTKGTFNGSIDLKQFSITVDGVKVFSGAKSKVKLSTETYTDYDFALNTADETFRLPLKNGKENLVGDEYIQISTLPANNATLTAPANGHYTISALASATTSHFYMTNLSNNLTVGEAGANLSNVYWNYVMPCKKGDKIQFHYESIAIQDGNFYFCPNIGNGTLYFYVGETVQNANLIDAGRIGEQLAGKVDTSNTQWAVNACMPDYTTMPLSVYDNTNFTAPYDGLLQGIVTCGQNAGSSYINFLNSNGTLISRFVYGYSASDVNQYAITLLVSKGITIKIKPTSSSYVWLNGKQVNGQLCFYPLKGDN